MATDVTEAIKSKKVRNLKGKKRAGFYYIDDLPYPSVTQILEIKNKPGLMYWFGEQVFYAVAKDPAISLKNAMLAPYQVSDQAKNRGTTVHSIVEAYKHTAEQLDVPEQFRGYAKAFYTWVNMYDAHIVEQERTIHSKKHRYGGTLDLLVKFGKDTLPYVVDIKTGKQIYEEAFLQTAAYQQALREVGVDTLGTAVLLLKEDGGFDFKVRQNTVRSFKGFLAAKYLWEAENQEMLEKIGYFDDRLEFEK